VSRAAATFQVGRLLFGVPANEKAAQCRSGRCNSWENLRNLLNRNALIWRQLQKLREINFAPGTHAPQQINRSIMSSAVT